MKLWLLHDCMTPFCCSSSSIRGFAGPQGPSVDECLYDGGQPQDEGVAGA
jgi:hypothetical protein